MSGSLFPKTQLANHVATAKRELQKAFLPQSNGLRQPHGDCRKIVVAGMFKTASGLGEAARQTYAALKNAGLSPVAFDLSGAFNQIDCEFEDCSPSLSYDPGMTVILHVNAPEVFASLKHMKLKRWHSCRIIGYWAWELQTPPSDWLSCAKHLDEIWTCSQFVTDAFAAHVSIPVRTVPIPITPPIPAAPFENGVEQSLKVLVMADGRSSFHRKNILSAVDIFEQAFPKTSHASLTIKTRNIDEQPKFAKALTDRIRTSDQISHIDGSLTDGEKWNLLAEHDIILSAHRSEGFGLHLAEAMSLGKLVAATGWSGNMEFMTQDNSILLPYSLVPANDLNGIYPDIPDALWADIDVGASAQYLISILQDSKRCSEIALQARNDIAVHLTAETVVKQIERLFLGNKNEVS